MNTVLHTDNVNCTYRDSFTNMW